MRDVPEGYDCEQVEPQEICGDTSPVTVPKVGVVFVTVTVTSCPKITPTVWALFIVTPHAPDPLQSEPQALKT